MNKTNFKMLGVKIGSTSLRDLTLEASNAVNNEHEQISFVCANPHSLVEATQDEEFRQALNHSEQVVADGVGTVLVGKLVGLKIKPRVTGADYFHSIMTAMNQAGGKRVFFMGSTQHVLDKIQHKASEEFPGLEAIGVYSPPFGDWTEEQQQEVTDAVNDFNPDVLWVGMTAPKQEKWVNKTRQKLNASVIGSIGAVFDFYAETHPRAPAWMHGNGLEWLYRLVREPRRMWRRNFVSAPMFIWLILQEKIRNSADQTASAS